MAIVSWSQQIKPHFAGVYKKLKIKKKYGLAWDNGDELFCHKATICNCIGLSPMNKRVLEENGAIVIQSAVVEPAAEEKKPQGLTLNDVKNLQKQLSELYVKKKEIEKTRLGIDGEIQEINEKLMVFYANPEEAMKPAEPAPEEYEMDPELAALMKKLSEPEKPPEPAPEEMDPELAALMKQLSEPQNPPEPAPEDEMDPELAALLKQLNTPAEETKPEPPPEEQMDPELAALLKQLNAAEEETKPEPPPEEQIDPELAALLKQLNAD